MTTEPARGRAAPRPALAAVLAFAPELALLAVFALVAVHALLTVDKTEDERYYLSAAREVVAGPDWSNQLVNQQPPLGLSGVGLLTRHLPPEQIGGLVSHESLELGRLGILPAGLLCALAVLTWARLALGRTASRLALLLFAAHPILAGYSALIAVDMWHAALLAAVGLALWGVCLRPVLGRLLLLGLALGLCLASKYTALMQVPVVLLLAAGAGFRVAWRAGAAQGMRRVLRAALRAGLAGLVVGVVALLALHACYGFGGGLAGKDSGAAWLEHVPLAGSLARLLPRPYVSGVQLAVDISSADREIFLNGRIAAGHGSYYAWCLLLKTPLAILALLAAACATRLRAWVTGRAPAGERVLALVCLSLIVPSLVWLSVGTPFQLGIRYVLQVCPLVVLLAATTACWPSVARAPAGWRLAAAGLVGASLVLDVAGSFADPIAYYNPLAGGQARAYRHFTDSNSDWTQGYATGLAWLRERYGEELIMLHAGDGPRFGRVAAYVKDLGRPDPADPTRARHWLDALPPDAHFRAAWYAYDVTPQSFAAAAERSADPRVRADLATALAASGDVRGARAACAGLPPAVRAPVERLLGMLNAPGPENRLDRASAWVELGRPDLAIAVGTEAGGVLDPDLRLVLALSRLRQGDQGGAITLLEPVPPAERSPREIMLLAQCYIARGDAVLALALLEADEQRLRQAVPQQADAALRKLRNVVKLLPPWMKAMQRQPSPPVGGAGKPLR